VLFTTSLEGFHSSTPDSDRYLILRHEDRQGYVTVGKGTDMLHLPGFTPGLRFVAGKTIMDKIFGVIPGVIYHPPRIDI